MAHNHRNAGDTGGSQQHAGVESKSKDKPKDESLAGKAREVASSMGDKAREAASSVSEKASEIASTVGKKAESATTSVGSGMKSLAETIRENAPQQGMLRSASTSVADTLASSGRYLQEEGLRSLGDDLNHLVRRNPIPALLVGIAFGFMIARATRS